MPECELHDEQELLVDCAKVKGSDVTGVVREDHAVYGNKWLVDNGFSGEWQVTVADDLHLQLDYDDPLWECETHFKRVLDLLNKLQGGNCRFDTFKSKGGNTHVIVTLLKSLPIMERVAWQAAFGSDPFREALHLQSIAQGELNPILLYTRKVSTDDPTAKDNA